MTSIQVDLDDDLARRLVDRAGRAGVTPAEVTRQALMDYLQRVAPAASLESFFGIGSSRVLRGANADELLQDGFGE